MYSIRVIKPRINDTKRIKMRNYIVKINVDNLYNNWLPYGDKRIAVEEGRITKIKSLITKNAKFWTKARTFYLVAMYLSVEIII